MLLVDRKLALTARLSDKELMKSRFDEYSNELRTRIPNGNEE